MFSKIKYILLTAQRDSLFFGLAALIVFASYLATFMGSTAAVEEGQTAMVYTAGIARIVLALGLSVFISFHIRRSFENREIDLMLVHPVSRSSFIFSYLIGYTIVAAFFVLFTACTLYGFAFYADAKPNLQGFQVWTLSILLESMLIAALAMTASLILKSSVMAVLLSLGFYFLARVAGFVLIIVTKPGNSGAIYEGFEHISKFIPRLDFFGKSEWLLYGTKSNDELWLFVIQAAIYITLLLILAVYDFKKKEF